MSTKKSAKLVLLLLSIAMLQSLLYLPARAAPSGQRLRALAGNFLIGYASRDGFNSMSDAAQYQDVARTEFNFVTPENNMKWDAIEPSNNSFNFSGADTLVAFAQANNMKIHGHTLVWHSQLPGWVANGSWTSTTLTNVMNNHIDKVMNHWTDGQIYAWDVVNEAFNEDGSRRSSVFQNVIGNGYIEAAFRRARAADPITKLIYNDYNVETVNSKSTAMYNMVADFKARGVPIDGVGLQMHLTDGGLDYNSLASNMARFAALGVEIYITEMDVRLPIPASQASLNNQATIYSNVLARCRAQSMCKALQVWGIPDKYSWVMSVFPGTGAPLIFDDNYNAKPAYFALQTGLGGGGVTNTPTRTATRTNTPTGGPTRTPTASATSLPDDRPDLVVSSAITAPQGWSGGCANNLVMGVRVTVRNNNPNGGSGPFVVDVSGTQQSTGSLAGGATVSLWFARTGSLLITADATNTVIESNESNNTLSYVTITATPPVTCTPTGGPSLTPTRTPTRTSTPPVTNTPTRTPTAVTGGTCSPVTSTITAPFTFDGAGTFCWQSSNLGSFINNWNMASLTINGVNFTNAYVPVSAYPAKINGFWYVSYTGNFPWSHFEAK